MVREGTRIAEIKNPERLTESQLLTGIQNSLKRQNIPAEDLKILQATEEIITSPNRVITMEEKYRLIAGEVEARMVEDRVNMSLEERANSLLVNTENIAEEDILYIKKLKQSVV